MAAGGGWLKMKRAVDGFLNTSQLILGYASCVYLARLPQIIFHRLAGRESGENMYLQFARKNYPA